MGPDYDNELIEMDMFLYVVCIRYIKFEQNAANMILKKLTKN